MTLDTVILASIYLLVAYVLFWLGKLVFDFLHRDFRIHEEVVERKNSALAQEHGEAALGGGQPEQVADPLRIEPVGVGIADQHQRRDPFGAEIGAPRRDGMHVEDQRQAGRAP